MNCRSSLRTTDSVNPLSEPRTKIFRLLFYPDIVPGNSRIKFGDGIRGKRLQPGPRARRLLSHPHAPCVTTQHYHSGTKDDPQNIAFREKAAKQAHDFGGEKLAPGMYHSDSRAPERWNASVKTRHHESVHYPEYKVRPTLPVRCAPRLTLERCTQIKCPSHTHACNNMFGPSMTGLARFRS